MEERRRRRRSWAEMVGQTAGRASGSGALEMGQPLEGKARKRTLHSGDAAYAGDGAHEVLVKRSGGRGTLDHGKRERDIPVKVIERIFCSTVGSWKIQNFRTA